MLCEATGVPVSSIVSCSVFLFPMVIVRLMVAAVESSVYSFQHADGFVAGLTLVGHSAKVLAVALLYPVGDLGFGSVGRVLGWTVIIVIVLVSFSCLSLLLILPRIRKKLEPERATPSIGISYEDIFENPFVPMLIVNPQNGHIMDANRMAQRFYGYSKQEMLGFYIWDINVLSKEELKKELAKAKTKKRNTFRFRHRLKSGEIKDVEVYSGPITIRGEKLLFSIIRDISSLLEWEKGLVEAKLEAESANQAKDDLLSVISHEMRTPLNPIIGFSSLLMGEIDDPEHIRQLEIINESAERLKQLIGDVLQFSKLTVGAYELTEHPFNLTRMICSIATTYNPNDGENEIVIENGQEPILEPLESGNCLLGDTGILHHIISNLVGNACKYTQHGRVVIRYGVLKEEEERYHIRIEVEDNGIGIAEDLKERIFEPFTQAEASFSRSFQGVGLGLAICRRLIAILDGKLCVESELGKGSRFWVELAMKRPNEKADTVDTPPLQINIGIREQLRSLNCDAKILLVEDSPFNIAYIRRFVQKIGCCCESFDNGADALNAFKNSRFDAVLMDLSLPQMDGFETARRIRDYEGTERRVPIIALTAHRSSKVRERCLESGFDEYIEKPVRPQVLRGVLASVLEKDKPSGEHEH